MRVVFCCLLSAICIAQGPASAVTSKPPFVLSISAEASPARTGTDSYIVKAGSEIYIKVHLTNTSTHDLELGYDADSRAGVCFGHQYDVRDSKGNPVQKRTISHPEIGSTGHGWPARSLKPSESIDICDDRISGLYDLSRPGEYAIQLFRAVSDNLKDAVVKSNAITVKVKL
jgi:hypothetical protein